jgi:hypothetical protein
MTKATDTNKMPEAVQRMALEEDMMVPILSNKAEAEAQTWETSTPTAYVDGDGAIVRVDKGRFMGAARLFHSATNYRYGEVK